MNRAFVYIILVFVLMSCTPSINSDVSPPIIENLEIVNLDTIGNKEFFVGTNIQFSANFIDNQGLGYYKFDIHFSGDGHRHVHSSSKKNVEELYEWNFTKNGDLKGTEQNITFNKTIGLDVNSGPYHCVVYAIDAEGDSAEFVKSSFLISRVGMPFYTITSPDFTDYKVGAGGIINIIGTIRAVRGLSKLEYFIRVVDDYEAENLVENSEIIEGEVKDKSLDFDISIPSDATPGKYILLLLASDKLGNVGEYTELIEII